MSQERIAITPDETTAQVDGGDGRLTGTLHAPGDKSISHRAVMLAALAEGTSQIEGLSTGSDVAHTVAAIAAMGATVATTGTSGELTITGTNGKLTEPTTVVDLGNAGTGLRLFCGLWAGSGDGLAVFVGDQSLARRPIDRIAEPLRQMGATIDAREGRYTPVVVHARGRLRGIDYASPAPSAGIKSAVLLAGLNADDTTILREPVPTRRHTEELLADFGADIDVEGDTITLAPSRLVATDILVPADPSQAAFWACAAAATPGSHVQLPNLYLGPLRSEYLDVLERMGADLGIDRATGTVTITGTQLHGTDITPAEVPALIDEFPALAIAAALADGKTTITGASELRIKESDRIDTIAAMLRAFDLSVDTRPDGYTIEGRTDLHPGVVEAHGDHRIAMAAALLALHAPGPSTVNGWSAVATSYPSLAGPLNDLTA